MNYIISSLKKFSNVDDILKEIYGIDSNEKFDICVIAPSWRIEKIVPLNNNVELIYQDQFSISNRIFINNKKILYVNLQIGSSNIIDFCLCCNSLNCENFVLIGSAGALRQDYQLGDFVIPEYSISGDGASLYLHESLNSLNLFKKAFPDKELSHKLYDVCNKLNMKPKIDSIFTIDTMMCEYYHLKQIKEMGAGIIEMETSAFFNAIKYINKKGCALLVVSDNSANGNHFFGRTSEELNRYRTARNQIVDVIKLFL